jgi:hypothetical protein
VIIGVTSSYLLEALQRRWALDDQRREWKRKELEYYSKLFIKVTQFCVKIANDYELSEKSINELFEYIMDIGINPPPFNDSELNDLDIQINSELEKIYALGEDGGRVDIKDYRKITLNVLDLAIHLQKRVNVLIEETYK